MKRKRGKKFVYRGDDAEGVQKTVTENETNPFENHSKSKRQKKDEEAREGLVEEYKNRGRESTFVDKRIGERAKNLTDDQKMHLRYMKEQKDRVGL